MVTPDSIAAHIEETRVRPRGQRGDWRASWQVLKGRDPKGVAVVAYWCSDADTDEDRSNLVAGDVPFALMTAAGDRSGVDFEATPLGPGRFFLHLEVRTATGIPIFTAAPMLFEVLPPDIQFEVRQLERLG